MPIADTSQYDTDKAHYLRWYDPFFAPLSIKPLNLLEIGIYHGGSLLMWHDYFPQGSINGIDLIIPIDFPQTERIRIFQGNQTDVGFLKSVAREVAPDGFDIIIDDASHYGRYTKTTFWSLFDHLKPGGYYVIEDWGTGYRKEFKDGHLLNFDRYQKESQKLTGRPLEGHNYGMVGFIKQLVDEQGAGDVTLSLSHPRKSKFEQIVINPAFVLVEKAK